MASPKRHGFILGATGAVGQQLLRQLIDSDKFFKLHLPVRSEIDQKSKKIVTYPFEKFFRPWELDQNITDFFYCFGSTLKQAGSFEAFRDLELSIAHQALVVAKQVQARRFYLISAKGVDPQSFYGYLRVKSEVEKVLKDHLFQAFYVYRPSLILAPRRELRVMELVAQRVLSPLRSPLQNYLPQSAPVSAEQISRAIVFDALSGEEGSFIRENKQIIELSKL
jgi:uncharacterized protein YbjT (DUF2867 family)